MVVSELLDIVTYKTQLKVVVVVANGIGQGDYLSVFRFSKCSLQAGELEAMHIADREIKKISVGLLNPRDLVKVTCLVIEVAVVI